MSARTTSGMRRHGALPAVWACAVGAALAGCGQKGPLQLPSRASAPASTPAAQASAPPGAMTPAKP